MRGKGLLLVQSGNGQAQEVQGTFVKILSFSSERKRRVCKIFIYSPKYLLYRQQVHSCIISLKVMLKYFLGKCDICL